ncbi:MAG: hypothetical protein ACLPJJ_03305 [Acidocella sp.]|uniref:hypothetical protein n=1 Tax=Acidocella sp. TaxID=50710 RepID=UPI003FD6E218
MKRLVLACLASVALYVAVFAALADRPLSLGVLRLELLQKTASLAAMPSPRLVILAGSNGPYSHSCAVLGAMLNLPCENAGIAVGIGLDDVFARYAPLLRPGDVVYMPMELQQYTMSSSEYRAAVDGAFLLRHDRAVLRELSPGRVVGAVFCCQLADLLEAAAEMPIAALHAVNAGALLRSEYNAQGDRIDNDLAGPLPPDVLAAISAIYAQNGAAFLVLPNESHYPALDFFNSEDHLAKPCQYVHSIALAVPLGAMLHWPFSPPPPAVAALAATCPSAS